MVVVRGRRMVISGVGWERGGGGGGDVGALWWIGAVLLAWVRG